MRSFPLLQKLRDGKILSKLKTLFRYIKYTAIATLLIAIIVGISAVSLDISYREGQMHTCNVMLRKNPNTKLFGYYCENMPDGVMIRSTVLKKTIFNITKDKSY